MQRDRCQEQSPTLWDYLKLFFDITMDMRRGTSIVMSAVGIVRMDICLATISPALCDYLGWDWCSIEQAFCIERTCIQQGKPMSVEVHYGKSPA